MKLGWEAFGGYGIFFISMGYAGIGLMLTQKFQRFGHSTPVGICATFDVCIPNQIKLAAFDPFQPVDTANQSLLLVQFDPPMGTHACLFSLRSYGKPTWLLFAKFSPSFSKKNFLIIRPEQSPQTKNGILMLRIPSLE